MSNIWNNKVIEVLNEEHGKQVIEFWKSKGFNVRNFKGENSRANLCNHRFYGIIDRKFNCYNGTEVMKSSAEIIELPKDNPYPKVMEVSTSKYFNPESTSKRVVIMEKCGKFIAWNKATTLKETENVTATSAWDYARDIEDTKVKELTLQDIADKFGLNVKQIRIKDK